MTYEWSEEPEFTWTEESARDFIISRSNAFWASSGQESQPLAFGTPYLQYQINLIISRMAFDMDIHDVLATAHVGRASVIEQSGLADEFGDHGAITSEQAHRVQAEEHADHVDDAYMLLRKMVSACDFLGIHFNRRLVAQFDIPEAFT